MRRIVFSLLSIICLFSRPDSLLADQRPEVVIGATMPLSGNVAFFGEGFRHAAQMALEALGPTHYRYSLIFEDDQASAGKALAAFRKLTTAHRAAVVFSATANTALAIAPVARQKNVLHLGISSDPTFADAVCNFNIWPAPEIPARALVNEFKQRGFGRIALLGLNHAWPRSVLPAVKELAGKAGIITTMEQYFLPGESDFRPLLLRLGKSDAEIAVVLSWSPELEIFARQYHELNLKIPLTSEFAFESSQAPELFNGFWFVNLVSPEPAYRERFKSRSGYFPYAQMELGDIMIKLVVHAVENAGDGKVVPDRGALSAQLLKIKDWPSILGPISINSRGILEASYALKVMRNGVAEPQ